MNEELLSRDIGAMAGAIPDVGKLRGASVLVTGAGGLVGSLAVRALLRADMLNGLGLTVYALGRDRRKLEHAVGAESEHLRLFTCDLANEPIPCPGADYVIHCASPTASSFFCDHPVETAGAILHGTEKILKHALRYGGTRKIVFVSSIEVYGEIHEDVLISESCQGFVDPLQPRSSYPMAKRMAESLCKAYCSEYGVPVVIARLTQTFGPGVAESDRRVFVQFAKSALGGRDIVLHTPGRSAKPYIYTVDAVTALFYLLLRGECGIAYNVANEDTFCSVRQMAELVAGLGKRPVDVVTESGHESVYPPESRLRLDCSRIRGLGWEASVDLAGMYRRLMDSMDETKRDLL